MDKFTIIRDLSRFLQPGLISSSIFCKKLDFPTANHNRYIRLHWIQFPMIGNIYLELKLLRKIYKNFRLQRCHYVTNKVTKRLSKLSNKEIYFTLLSSIIKLAIVLNTTFLIHFMDKLPLGTPYSQS